MNRHYLYIPMFGLLFAVTCSHLKEAYTAFEAEDFTKTIGLTQRAVAADSTDIDAYLLLIRSYCNVDSLDRALETALTARRQNPGSKAIDNETANVYVALGDLALAEQRPQLALSSFLNAEDLSEGRLHVLRRTADLYFNLGRLDPAKERYSQILQSEKDTSGVRERIHEIDDLIHRANGWFSKGMKSYRESRFKTARSHFDQALELKSDFDDAAYFGWMSEGRVLMSRGSQRALWDAISAFGKASGIRPQSAEPYVHMAQAYERKDDDEFVNAIDAYETALKLDPEGPDAPFITKRLDIVKKRKEKLDKFWGRKK